MTARYEVVGALDRSVADAIGTIGGDAILIDDGNDEILVARPATGDDDD
ncbi:hypothetical protein [Natrinema halophilum]|uniref:Uncharacterized protein n=1 Tax=Natrinema halophilum TaxID=1699371 RepID=A0A7D5L371_9EURY|nr:hypothetical protein [Natrinema halophilum]QLG47865.1 hypothetical protein HYG82_02900 [Natrinema halophilum]